MKYRFGLVVLGFGLAWACGDDEKPPPTGSSNPNAGEGGDAGTGASGKGSGGTGKGGSAGAEAGQGGATAGSGGSGDTGGGSGEGPGGAGTGTGGTGGPPPPCPDVNMGSPPSGVCDPTGMLGPTMNVVLPDGAANLLSITPDELTILWDAALLMGTTYYLADRTSPNDPFGTPRELTRDVDYSTLSPDGLRLVFVSGGGASFMEFTRTARDTAFSTTAAEGAFSTLNADAVSRDLTFAGCVIAPDDLTLYYLVNDPDGNPPLRISKRTGDGPWPVGQEIAACEFESHGDFFSQPTGVSSDGLTFFFYDWARGQARAAWRRTADGPFEWFEDLGTREHAQPNTACDRLYYTSGGPAFSTIE